MQDQITFEIGFGLVGKVVERFVLRSMRRTFAHRHRVVERLLSGTRSGAA